MRTGFDVLCARMMPGMANGAAVNAPTAARRVIFNMSIHFIVMRGTLREAISP